MPRACAGTSIEVDGDFGPNTESAYRTLMSQAGLSGNIWDAVSLYESLLDKIALAGVADTEV